MIKSFRMYVYCLLALAVGVLGGRSNPGGFFGVGSRIGPNLFRPPPPDRDYHLSWNRKSQTTSSASDSLSPRIPNRPTLNLPRGGYANAEGGSFFDDDESSSSSSSSNNNDSNMLYDPSSPFVRLVGTVTQLLISLGRLVLPPTVAIIKGVVKFYRALPMDAITAQIGLVYCFLGGYYPTLFSSLQAAQYCGWQVMVSALADLTDEAMKVIDATAGVDWDDMSRRDVFLQQTNIVLKTVDPMKINQAASGLYTTWLGVSTVLQREYARVISLSLTLASGIEAVARVVLQPPLNLITPYDYRRWVPAVIGWGSKAAAMNVAWRIQRVLTAATSAIAGGAMVARSVLKLLNRKGIYVFGDVQGRRRRRRGRGRDPDETTLFEDMVGFSVGSLGFYTQIECQMKNNFSFQVPWPLSILTFPFDMAEKWIQWYITEY